VKSRWHLFRRALLTLSGIFCTVAAGHDLTTSYATIRFKADALELQIKIAADSAWPAVQATVAPDTVFVLEEFETVGKAKLLSFARTMEELTVDGAAVAPRQLDVEVIEDNFLFTFVYPRPKRGEVQLTEKYLKLMAPDYASRVVIVDQKEKPLASKTLHVPNVTLPIALPPLSTGAPAVPATHP
jgi:hypothetical protein